MGIAADVGIERRHALGGLEDQKGDIAAFEMAPGHHYTEFLGLQLGLALTADARSVHKSYSHAFMLDNAVDGVSRRTRDRRNHRPLLAHQPIEQRGLPDIRMTDDRDANFTRRFFQKFSHWH